ncbi:MAG: nucleotidyltransferase domain-containing protein [Candidatus Calescibacterium sp.]
MIIFGSAISGKRKPDSDIDILVISEKVPHDLFERAKIKVKIESAGDKKLAFCKIKVLQNQK